MEVLSHQRCMQTERNNQPTFFDLAMQQRGGANRVLETINREVDFSDSGRTGNWLRPTALGAGPLAG